ncbi:sensor domain-containing diguanylate cyclase [Jeotgalibacillus soli]|uniref:Diguanylate cyclase (GGDEF) domain-containing protein n=1 Tax=Jeotgalibacillus soli TaxID=889306 RepID=A0A0C2S3Q8_9BACL|nr:sensor domain-containing diguanylate cyclase [Jeotgalibacillus soli]KIL48599.1 diguanylate cyclase (GGDEF) domain-containing protein [Jeotgalibacillus soli]
MKKPIRLSIQFLVLSLLAFAVIGTFVGSTLSSVLVSKNNLEKNYLMENQYYAQKLASTTDSLFDNMIKSLTMESGEEEYSTADSKEIYEEVKQTLESTDFFNSVYFVDQTGHIRASAPDRGLEGTVANRIGAKEALKKKVPLISEPYVAVTGKLILLVSVPVFDDSGSYKGFIGGTIHLHEENSLTRVLGQHPEHENDSYVYVVDSKGNVIYHPDSEWINANVKENEVVKQVMEGKTGSQEVMTIQGVSMLAGYAASTSNWGIVSQAPKKSVIEPTIEMAKQVSFIAIPFMIFVFVLTLAMLKKIVNPIRMLAIYAKQMTLDPSSPTPRIPDWYFELKELKRAILKNVNFYEKKLTYAEGESNLDPLTGYYNRRSLEKKISHLGMYSIVLFDIDRFKTVNDQFGHQVGDEVLTYMSELAKKETRESDLCFRIGGEEFLIVLPETDLALAQTIAERIRKTTEAKISPTGKPITISMGIGNSPTTASDFSELFKVTDQALYKAKEEGRNRVIIANRLNNNKN